MELILPLLAYGKANPAISLAVVLIFLFLYSVIILRKRRAISTIFESDVKEVEQLVAREKKELADMGSRGYYFGSVVKSEASLEAIRKGSAMVDSYNHLLLAGLAWAIPVYYLWLPLAVLTLPVGLALACVYPDKLKNLLAKTVDNKAQAK